MPDAHPCYGPQAFLGTALGPSHSFLDVHPMLHPLELQKEIRSGSKKKSSSSFCCLPTIRAQDTKTAVTQRKNRLRDHVDLSMCQQVRDKTGGSEF